MRPTNPPPLALFAGAVLAGVLAVVAIAATHSWWVVAGAAAMVLFLGLGTMIDVWGVSSDDRPAPASSPPPPAPAPSPRDEPGEDYRGPDARHRVLVVTSEPVAADTVLAALTAETGSAMWPSGLAVMVVSPEGFGGVEITNDQRHYDAARRAEDETVASLRRAEILAAGHVGDHDAVQAIADALELFPAERVLVFAHGRYAPAYRRAVDPVDTARRIRRPVRLVDDAAQAA